MLSCNIPVIVIISNFLIIGIRNYSIYWAKLFQKIRHDYMITSSKHSNIMNPQTKGEITHAKVCTKAVDICSNSEKPRLSDLWLDHVTVSSLLLTQRTRWFSILLYTILHKFRKFIHSIHMCNNNNFIIKIQAKGIKTQQCVAQYNQRRSFIKLMSRNTKLMAHWNLIDKLSMVFTARVH